VRALTPLKWRHINPYDTFTLDIHEWRPLDGLSARRVILAP
jgi:hypothetical protein